MDYIVSAAAVRAAHLLGERPCWQNSIYLAGTRCKCQWGPRDPVWNVSDHPSQDLSSLCGDRAGWGGIFFFIFSHGGNRSLFQLELRDLLWDCSGGRETGSATAEGGEGNKRLHPAYPWKPDFFLFLSHKCLIFLLKRIRLRKAVVSLSLPWDPAQLQGSHHGQHCCHCPSLNLEHSTAPGDLVLSWAGWETPFKGKMKWSGGLSGESKHHQQSFIHPCSQGSHWRDSAN